MRSCIDKLGCPADICNSGRTEKVSASAQRPDLGLQLGAARIPLGQRPRHIGRLEVLRTVHVPGTRGDDDRLLRLGVPERIRQCRSRLS